MYKINTHMIQFKCRIKKWPRGCCYPPRDPAHRKDSTVDEKSLAQGECTVRVDQEQEHRSCFYCLEGWVFLGSIGYDGEEVVEAIRCRRCGGTGRING
jgi:hypothetical protein